MQTVTVDLNKSPDIKDAVADMEPGSDVCLHGTIKSLDEQTLVVTVDELSIPKEEKEESDDGEMKMKKPAGGNEGSDAMMEDE